MYQKGVLYLKISLEDLIERGWALSLLFPILYTDITFLRIQQKLKFLKMGPNKIQTAKMCQLNVPNENEGWWSTVPKLTSRGRSVYINVCTRRRYLILLGPS